MVFGGGPRGLSYDNRPGLRYRNRILDSYKTMLNQGRTIMNGKIARILFLGVCLILAILLITKTISSIWGSVFFAIALVLLGGTSGGFRKQ